jgi:hypothetical protein
MACPVRLRRIDSRFGTVEDTMTPTHKCLALAACLAILTVATPAVAQSSDGNVFFQSGLLPKKPGPGLPDVRTQPLAWPRLDAGAILCRSEADLSRLAERRTGHAVDGPVDCQVIRVATPITIMERKGPGRTEVKPTAAQPMESGWTDAWLPDKAPNTASSATR